MLYPLSNGGYHDCWFQVDEADEGCEFGKFQTSTEVANLRGSALSKLNLVHLTKRWIKLDYFPDGFNIGMNCGRASGQTVMHFHCHVIPRYNGDMEIPDGGIRHCIDGNGNYKTEE